MQNEECKMQKCKMQKWKMQNEKHFSRLQYLSEMPTNRGNFWAEGPMVLPDQGNALGNG